MMSSVDVMLATVRLAAAAASPRASVAEEATGSAESERTQNSYSTCNVKLGLWASAAHVVLMMAVGLTATAWP